MELILLLRVYLGQGALSKIPATTWVISATRLKIYISEYQKGYSCYFSPPHLQGFLTLLRTTGRQWISDGRKYFTAEKYGIA